MARIAKESWILIAICAADLVTTIWLVCAGMAIEGNPVMGHYLDQGIHVFIAAKVLLVAGPLIILEWARRSRPAFVHSMMRATILMYLGFYGVGVLRLNSGAVADPPPTPEEHATREWAARPPTKEELAHLRQLLQRSDVTFSLAAERQAALTPSQGAERNEF